MPGVALTREKEEALLRLNPDKIYLENVRSLFGVTSQRAFDLCEAAVRQGLFKRGIEARCPDGSVGATADSEQSLPKLVHCWTEESGHLEECDLLSDSLPKVNYYRLNGKTSTVLHA